jgi:hypothetical protein
MNHNVATTYKEDYQMEKLNVRFPDTVKTKINDVGEVVDLFDSAVARAAMTLGLQKLQGLACINPDEAKSLIMSENAKHK